MICGCPLLGAQASWERGRLARTITGYASPGSAVTSPACMGAQSLGARAPRPHHNWVRRRLACPSSAQRAEAPPQSFAAIVAICAGEAPALPGDMRRRGYAGETPAYPVIRPHSQGACAAEGCRRDACVPSYPSALPGGMRRRGMQARRLRTQLSARTSRGHAPPMDAGETPAYPVIRPRSQRHAPPRDAGETPAYPVIRPHFQGACAAEGCRRDACVPSYPPALPGACAAEGCRRGACVPSYPPALPGACAAEGCRRDACVLSYPARRSQLSPPRRPAFAKLSYQKHPSPPLNVKKNDKKLTNVLSF